MKKTVALALVSIIILTGCAKKGTYPNLDFSDTRIIENKLAEDKSYYTLKYYSNGLSSDTMSYLITVSSEFEKARPYDEITPLEKEQVSCTVFPKEDDEDQEVLFKKVTDMQPDEFERAVVMRGYNGRTYETVNPLGGIEIADFARAKEITGYDEAPDHCWEPYLGDGTLAAAYACETGIVTDAGGYIEEGFEEYDVLSENDTCTLNGNKVNILKAAAFAKEYLESGKIPSIMPENFKVYPYFAEVYEYSDGNQSLNIRFGFMLDDIPVDASSVHGIEKENGGFYNISSCGAEVTMLTENSADRVRCVTLSGCNYKIAVREKCELKYSYDDCCKMLSDFLSKDNVFKVKSAELLYSAEGIKDKNDRTMGQEYEPKWRFSLENTGDPSLPILYVYISCTDGEIQAGE